MEFILFFGISVSRSNNVVQFSFEGAFLLVAGRRSEHAQLQHVSGRLVEGTNAGAIKQMIRPQAMRSLRSDAVAK